MKRETPTPRPARWGLIWLRRWQLAMVPTTYRCSLHLESGVAHHAKPKVRDAANHCLNHLDLSALSYPLNFDCQMRLLVSVGKLAAL